MAEEVKIIIRPMQSGDKAFIASTWMKGNYFGNGFYKKVNQSYRFKSFTDLVLRALDLAGTTVKIACDEKTPEWVVGFSVTEGDTLRWVHVKEDFRGKGIGSLLLDGKKIIRVDCTAQLGETNG